MPAPPNDNYNNAYVCMGSSGSLGQLGQPPSPGYNIGATSESHEPITGSVGKTVWYSYTPPSTGIYVFSTQKNGDTSGPTSSLNTMLRAYTGTSVSSSTEVTYFGAGSDTYNNQVYGFGKG